MPLMEPDEARYSDIASLMNRTGDYITPRLIMWFTLKNLPCATGQRHCHLRYSGKMNSHQGYLLPFVRGDVSSSFTVWGPFSMMRRPGSIRLGC